MLPTYSTKHCPEELLGIRIYEMGFERAYDPLYELATSLVPNNIWAEFGVGVGRSSKHLAKYLSHNGKFFLFDSWEGIPESWDLGPGMCEPKGRWKFSKLKNYDPRLMIVDGWFNQTLPYDFPEPLGLVNFDCDVYSSTKDALFGCQEYIVPGTVLIFDEIIGYTNYKDHEYKALGEWLEHTGYEIEWHAKERFAAIGVVK